MNQKEQINYFKRQLKKSLAYILWAFSPGLTTQITPFDTFYLDNLEISEVLRHVSTNQGFDVTRGSWRGYNELLQL